MALGVTSREWRGEEEGARPQPAHYFMDTCSIPAQDVPNGAVYKAQPPGHLDWGLFPFTEQPEN